MAVSRTQVEETRNYVKNDAAKIRNQITETIRTKVAADMEDIISKETGLQDLLSQKAHLESLAADLKDKLAKVEAQLTYYTAGEAIQPDMNYDRKRLPYQHLLADIHPYINLGSYRAKPSRLTQKLLERFQLYSELETLSKLDQLTDYLSRKATFCKSEDELAMLYAEFYRYDWRSAGLTIPPQLPEFFTVGNKTLKLLDYVPSEDREATK